MLGSHIIDGAPSRQLASSSRAGGKGRRGSEGRRSGSVKAVKFVSSPGASSADVHVGDVRKQRSGRAFMGML